MHDEQKQVHSAVIYLRVSTEEQVDNFSLDTQLEICTKEAERRGIEIISTFREEGKSAKTITGRPVLIEMLEYCRKNKKKIDAVIVYRLDRISRQTADYLGIRKKLAECDITLISATEPTGNSPTEKLVETILAGFAQLDNDVRSERTKNGMRARFLSGLSTSRPPLGYMSKDGYAIKDPETWDSIRRGWELMASGKSTLKEIAEFLTTSGVRQVMKGKKYKLRMQAVSRMFKNKFYAGIITSEKYPEEVKGQHVPMITEEMFYKVQNILSGRYTSANTPIVSKRLQNNPDFPLRRIVKCGKCGTPLTGAWSSGRKAKHAYYFCRKRCGEGSIKAYELDYSTAEYLRSISPTDECLSAFIGMLRTTYYKRVADLKKRKEHADTELTRLYEMRQALIQKNLSGVYSDEVFKEQNKLIEEQITSIRMTKDDDLVNKYNLQSVIEFMKEKFVDLGNTYQESDVTQIKVLLGSIFPSGMVWSYPGYSNQLISPLYQYISHFGDDKVSFGDPMENRTPITGMKTLCPNR